MEIVRKALQYNGVVLVVDNVPKRAKNLMRALAFDLISTKKGAWLPILIMLSVYDSIEPAVTSQLASLGRITDVELANWFMEQGGFVFLIEGIDDTNAKKVLEFVDRYRHNNQFCLISRKDQAAIREHLNPVVLVDHA